MEDKKVPIWVHCLWVGTLTGSVLAIVDYIMDGAFDKGVSAYNSTVNAVNTATVVGTPGAAKTTAAYSISGTLTTALGSLPAGTAVTLSPDLVQPSTSTSAAVSAAHALSSVNFNAAARALADGGANMIVVPSGGTPIRFMGGVST